MPLWSVSEWRARIGSSWLATGRTLKTKSSFRRSKSGWVQRVLTLNQVVAVVLMTINFIAINVITSAIVNSSYQHSIADLLESQTGVLSHWSICCRLLRYAYLLILATGSCSKFHCQFYHITIKLPLKILHSNYFIVLMQGFYLTAWLFCWLFSAIGPLIHPLLWHITFVMNEFIWIRSQARSFLTMIVACDQVGKLEANCTAVKSKLARELEKRGEIMKWLRLAKSLLNIVLPVAGSVIISLLLMSGDVEENPGPLDLDYGSVNGDQVLDEDNLSDVIEEVITIKSLYYELGRSLRLKISELDRVRDKSSSNGDEKALQDVLLLWLNRNFNVEKFGPPTWRMLVEAVDKKTGGDNHELAKDIASGHPAVGKSYSQTTSSTPSTPMKSKHATRHFQEPMMNVARHDRLVTRDSSTLKKETQKFEESGNEYLSINDVREVLDLLWEYRAKWNLIGVQLGLTTSTLDAIDVEHRKVADALLEVIKHWLRQTSPKPTRTALTMAIVSKCLTEEAASIKVLGNSGGNHIEKIEDYGQYLKSLYRAKTLSNYSDDQWPPPCTNKVFKLSVTKCKVRRGYIADDSVARQKSITGKVDRVLRQKGTIEIEDVLTNSSQHRKVLIEGGPGCGKSTLSFDICHKWAEGASFQGYKLVVLIRLRDLAIQNAKSLAELLPRRNDIMGQEVEEAIAARDGDNVLLIFDGWDELSRKAKAFSLFQDLMKGSKLPACTIIVTSRQSSSAGLYSLVDVQLEILGFTKSELHEYFKDCLQGSTEAVERLMQRIRRNQCIEGSCYLPLNASILVHLFKCRDNELPTTQYGVFTELVCTCIFRHLKKTGQPISELKSLDDLPPTTAKQFQQLCKVAYEGVMQDVVIFNLRANYDTLGLLQGVESLAMCGKSYSYNFLHLSIQELLCAIHMANELDEKKQTEKFKELFGKPRFMLVFQFFAAKTKLKNSGISEVIVQVARKCSVENSSSGDKALLVSLIHCLSEAQDAYLCRLVATELRKKLILYSHESGGISLSPADCFHLDYFLTFCKWFDVVFTGCSIGNDHCKVLFKQREIYDLRSLKLDKNSIGDGGAIALSEAIKKMPSLQRLNLNDNSIHNEGAFALSKSITKMTKLSELNINGNCIKSEGADALSAAGHQLGATIYM